MSLVDRAGDRLWTPCRVPHSPNRLTCGDASQLWSRKITERSCGRGPLPCPAWPVRSPSTGRAPAVEVRRSARRRRTVSAYRDGDATVVLIPARFSKAEERRWVAEMVARLQAREARRQRGPRRSDEALLARARQLSTTATSTARPDPTSVRWVDQHGRPAGARARRPTARSGCPAGCGTCPAGCSTTCWCTSWRTCWCPATAPDFWELVGRYPRSRARPRLPGGRRRRGSPGPVRRATSARAQVDLGDGRVTRRAAVAAARRPARRRAPARRGSRRPRSPARWPRTSPTCSPTCPGSSRWWPPRRTGWPTPRTWSGRARRCWSAAGRPVDVLAVLADAGLRRGRRVRRRRPGPARPARGQAVLGAVHARRSRPRRPTGGGLVALACRLPVPAWLPVDVDLDEPYAVERLKAAAPTPADARAHARLAPAAPARGPRRARPRARGLGGDPGAAQPAEPGSSSPVSPLRRTNPSGSSRSSAVGSRSGCAQSSSRPSAPRCSAQRPPQRRGLPQPARPQLQPDQGGEGLLGRPAGGPAPAQRLAQRRRRRAAGRPRPPRRRRRPSPRPARAASPAGPARPAARASPTARTCRRCSARCMLSGSCGSHLGHRRARSPRGPRVMPRAYASTASSSRCRSHGTCANSRWYAASRSARNSRTSSAGRSSPCAERGHVLRHQRRDARPGRAAGRRRCWSATSPASLASAWPTWAPNISPPTWPTIPAAARPRRRPPRARIWPIAPTTRDATGSQQLRPGRQGPLHPLDPRPGLDAGRRRTAAAVTGSSQWSASRIASAICERSTGGRRAVAGGERRDAPSAWPGPSSPGRSDRDSICCSAANSGALPARSSGMPPTPASRSPARTEDRRTPGRTGPSGRALRLVVGAVRTRTRTGRRSPAASSRCHAPHGSPDE